jgi:hypothetical protein
MKKLATFVLIGISLVSACQPATSKTTAALTFTPTNTVIPTETITPILTGESISTPVTIHGGWSSFYAEEYGFRFLYPAVYDKGFYDRSDPIFCNIQSRKEDGKFNVSVGTVRIIAEKTGQSLEDISDAYMKDKSTDWDIRSQIRTEIDGLPAVKIEYGRKRPPRQGFVTFLLHDDDLLTIDYYEGNFLDCAPIDTGYSSYWVYEQVINTLKFDQ